MTETVLPTQPYPGVRPWVDLSPYLVNGAAPFVAGSVAALPDGNLIHYAIRIRTEGVDPDGTALQRRRFMEGLPAHLRPHSNTPVFADFDGQPVSVQVVSTGQVQITAASGRFLNEAALLGLTLTTLRRAG